MRNPALIASLLVFCIPYVHAAEPSSRPVEKQHSAPGARVAPSVLNFDADVIEGEKTNPDLFIQLGNQQPSLEAVIYGRKNFNEFQKHEAPWRPVFRELTPSAGAKRAQGSKTARPGQ